MSSKKKSSGRRRQRRNKRIQSRFGMLVILAVVLTLAVVLGIHGSSLSARIEENQAKMESLDEQIAEEEARTEEIAELQEYMESDEYIEQIAREKIGLVKDNEILFKEND